MPLSKLWKTLTGRGTAAAASPVEHAAAWLSVSTDTRVGKPAAGAVVAAESADAGRPAGKVSRMLKRTPAPTESEAAAAVIASLVPEDARVVLEIGVGDGARCRETIDALGKRRSAAGQHSGDSTPLRYLVNDPFETEGGPMTLRNFHRVTAGCVVRPQVFPQPIGVATTRIAHTVGGVDAVIVSELPANMDLNALSAMLIKVAHGETVLINATDAERPNRTRAGGNLGTNVVDRHAGGLTGGFPARPAVPNPVEVSDKLRF